MSLSVNPLSIVQALEPRTKIYNERSYLVLRGGSQASWKPVISTSYSNSAIQFTAPPPNPNIIVDRKVLVNMQFLVTLNGTSDGVNNIYQVGNDAPRAHPIPYITNTLNCTINNTQVSINLSDVIDPLLHYWDPVSKREIDDSLSPSMLDQSQNYSDLTGGIRNPLNSYASSVSGGDSARGGFSYTVLTNTLTQATILLNVSDYLYLPPFLSDQQDAPGFIGVQTLDFNFTLGDLSRVWSHSSSGHALTSITAVINSNPILFFNYITPDPLMEIPRSVVYPYYEVQRYPTSIGAPITFGTPVTVQSANIQLHSIPTKMYLFIRRRNADRTALTTDTFGRINSLSIQWNNQNSLLSSASIQDLYHMSQVNGLNLSWSQFNQYVGSVVCVQFGRDICLQANEAAGMLGTYQLQVNANVSNLNSSEALNMDFYIVTVSEGSFTIQDNRAIANIGCISQRDVLNSLQAPMVDYNSVLSMRGASFWSNVKDFFSDVGRGIKKAYDTVAPVVKEALPYAMQAKKLLGYGAYSGGARSGGVANKWTDFVRDNAGSGKSMKQLSAIYKGKKGSRKSSRKASRKVSRKSSKRKGVKRCAVGTRKACVKKPKGGVLYEGDMNDVLYGGELIDRDMMSMAIQN